MVRAYLLSLLVRQRLALKDQFERRYPHPWLVWEPGVWRAAASAIEQSTGSTRIPSDVAEDRPPQGDALCFELSTGGEGPRSPLRLGREPGSDIVINDLSVSREHLILAPDEQAHWRLQTSPASKTTLHRGREVPPGSQLPLECSDRVKIGDISLTFYGAQGFLERLRVEARKFASASS